MELFGDWLNFLYGAALLTAVAYAIMVPAIRWLDKFSWWLWGCK